jgi:tRNA-modifying protein YgfZ
MPDNPQASWFALSDHSIVCLSGRDALAFAQSQFMNDVSALSDGGWQWNGWLTPKGRVIALFALLRIDGETLWLVLPDLAPEALVMSLRRFVFRSKVTIAAHEDLTVRGRMAGSERSSGNHWTSFADKAADQTIELDLSGQGGGRAMRIGPADSMLQTNAEALLAWKRLDLAHGWPRLGDSQHEQWTPQQLSLERLTAFSVKKGCYPGQEIVARTHYLGQAKRGLALLRTDTPMTPGTALEHNGRTLGTVVSASGDTALAVVGLEAIGERDMSSQTQGSPAMREASWRFEPLFDGLRR